MNGDTRTMQLTLAEAEVIETLRDLKAKGAPTRPYFLDMDEAAIVEALRPKLANLRARPTHWHMEAEISPDTVKLWLSDKCLAVLNRETHQVNVHG